MSKLADFPGVFFAAVVRLQYKTAVTPWVGLRKINVSYWCWEDMSPFTNTSLQWLPGEPSDAGFCGYLAESASSSLKAQSCINPVNGSLCERPGEGRGGEWVSR